jgi:hypothetical protein
MQVSWNSKQCLLQNGEMHNPKQWSLNEQKLSNYDSGLPNDDCVQSAVSKNKKTKKP